MFLQSSVTRHVQFAPSHRACMQYHLRVYGVSKKYIEGAFDGELLPLNGNNKCCLPTRVKFAPVLNGVRLPWC